MGIIEDTRTVTHPLSCSVLPNVVGKGNNVLGYTIQGNLACLRSTMTRL